MDSETPQPLPPESLRTQRLLLRKHEVSLARRMFEFIDRDRARLAEFLPWAPSIRSVDDEEKYILQTRESWQKGQMFAYGIFLAEEGDEGYMGNVGVHNVSWSDRRAELGYWIGSPYEGRGYVTEAVRAIGEMLFEVGFHRIEIHCSTLNARSAGVPERCGYRLEGTLRENAVESGAFRDTRVYAKLRTDRAAGDPSLRSPEEVVREFWARFDRRDYESTVELMAEGVVFEWPQSRERIRGASNVVAVNRNYPGEWRTIPRRIVTAGETVVSEVTVTNGQTTVFAVSFFTVRDGRIRAVTEYWGDGYPAPEWRSRWVERY